MYARRIADAWVELQPGRDIEIDGVLSSYQTMTLWTPQMRATRGIETIVDDAVPAGKIAIGNELVDDAGTPRRVWTLIDAPPAPVPEEISNRQFAQQLAIDGTITEAEALAWAARGDLPAAMEAAVLLLPIEQQFAARMLLASAKTYQRSHWLVPVLGALLDYDSPALDAVWRAAALL
jgi:hypothetical protein